MKKYLIGFALLCTILGCGGGGATVGSGSSSIFITDDLSTNYDHVWVTITQVDLGRDGGGSATVFNNPAGTTVDLRSLRDVQGRRFKFLSRDDGLSGAFTSVTVTLKENVVLFPTSATTGQPRIFAGSASGLKQLSTTFASRSFGPGNDDFVIDFDLSSWNEDGTFVTGANIGSVTNDNSLNDLGRHEREHYSGSITGLSGIAPNQSFTLSESGGTFVVQCDSSTRIDISGSNSNPVLANGQSVKVRGAFDAVNNKLLAERVQIRVGDNGNDDETYGSVSNINSGAGTLDLAILNSEFLPAGDPIHVTTTGGTIYRLGSGLTGTKDEFFAAIQNNSVIEAEGSYDFATNTLTATKLKIEDGPGDNEDNAEIKGATSLASLGTHTFKINATNFSGLNVAPGTVITVTTNGSTEFRGLNGGGSITESAFYSASTNTSGQLAEVEGFWDGTTLTATKCKLEDSL